MDEIKRGGELERLSANGYEVGFPRRRRRISAWAARIAICVAVCLAVGVAISSGGGEAWARLRAFAIGGGFDFDDNGFLGDDNTIEETAEENESTSAGGIFNESEEDTSEKVSTEESESKEGDEVIAADLSDSERGDAYIINYSDLKIDAEGLLEMGFHADLSPTSQAPIVLILHTHTSEGYADYDALEPTSVLKSSVVALGETLATTLNECGIPTVHCTVIHDGEGDAYENAAKTIEAMMRIYPTLEYVIDLHRMILTDNEGNAIKTCSADASAQIRITVSSEGALTKGALSLALCLRRELNSNGAKMCMPIVLTDAEYNAASALYYLKLDVGSLGNTSSEAMAAAERFAEALEALLKARKH